VKKNQGRGNEGEGEGEGSFISGRAPTICDNGELLRQEIHMSDLLHIVCRIAGQNARCRFERAVQAEVLQ